MDNSEIIDLTTDKALRNLSDYYECYGQPLPISHLIQPYAAKLHRNSIEWFHVEDRLKERGCKVVLSPQNKKYVFPQDTGKDLETMVLEVIAIEQEKNRNSGRKKRAKHD